METNDSPRSWWSKVLDPRAKFDFICFQSLENCVVRIRAYERNEKAKNVTWTALLGASQSEVGFSYHNPNMYDFWITHTFRKKGGGFLVSVTDGYLVRTSEDTTHISGYIDLPSIISALPVILVIIIGGIVLQHLELSIFALFMLIIVFIGQRLTKEGQLNSIMRIFNCDEVVKEKS